jgi:FAD/FMN-containing dehydrogenase
VTDQRQDIDVAADLDVRMDGQVLTAGDPGYDQARTPHFGFRHGEPVGVVRPAHSGDVAAAIETATATGLSLHVRGGGHHAAGHSTGDGLLVDLGSLNRLDFDRSDQSELATVWAGAGLTAGEVTAALGERGLAVGFGDSGSVGIGGLTLGGGIGFLSRRDGLTIDNVLGVEIVTADGRVHRVDATHEPDLFWAVRGGGGNFGIATRFGYRTVPVSEIYGGVMFLPATPQAIQRLAAASTSDDDALTVIASVMAMPPMDFVPAELHGQLVVMARVCYSGDPAEGERMGALLRLAAKPLADLLGPMPYSRLFEEPAPSRGAVVAVRSLFVDHIGTTAAEVMLEHLSRSDAWLRMVQFRGMGGAIGRVDPEATAFGHRRRRFMVTIASNDQPDLAQARAWVEDLAADLSPTQPGGYVGFFGPHDGDRIGEAYPPGTLDRLRGIKATYDPQNLFRHNDNITPAPDGTVA